MSPEVAATFTLLGVLAGAAISGGIALRVNDRDQKAQDRRLEVQFAEAAAKEKRDLALEVRRHRLQPAVDLLTALEQVVGVHLEASAVDALRPQWEGKFGPIDGAAWEEAKSKMLTVSAPGFTTIVGEYFPKIMSIPLPDLVMELRWLIAIAVSMPSIPKMEPAERDSFLARIRSIRNRIDAEIIRGEWP